MTFASPAWLWALLLLPALAAVEWWAARRDAERTARFVSRALWPRVARQPSPRWRVARLGLLLLGAAGFVLALARPQWGIVREKVEREGVDVVFVLDTSGSMATADVPPNRFFLARAALLSLAQRLEGDRLALVAFEGEAYPLVPLTLDADALGLFLDTLEPGVVPTPGTSLGQGLERGLELFVDKERRITVMVLVSDGEDLEGEVEEAVKRAKAAGVVVHTVGVGTEQGQPVPDLDKEGNRAGFKKEADGSVHVSRLNAATLDAIARGTGGRSFRLTGSDTSLAPLAAAIEGMEQKSLAREWTYRKKERFQVPLGVGLASFALALLLPLPRLRRAAAAALLLLLAGVPAHADGGGVVDEVLLRPRRLTESGRHDWEQGDHPRALSSFEAAAAARPQDPRARFNLADALYKNGKLDEAGAIWKALGSDPASPLAAPSRYNLGNALYQKKDYPGAVTAYRDALRVSPQDAEARRNLELALRALQQQKQEQQKQQDQKKDEKKDQKEQQKQQGQDEKKQQQQKQDPQKQQGQQQRPKSEEEKEKERYEKEAGMPKERAMQLLQALQQDEKAEQKKPLAAKAARKADGKDW